MPPRPGAHAPRSLAEDLRARSDDALRALLRARPDLAWPPPAGTLGLAARAGAKLSVARALDRLDTPSLQVLEVVVAIGEPTTTTAVVAACGAEPGGTGEQVRSRLATAHEAALLWGGPETLYPTRALAEALGPTPAGLGPTLREAVRTASPSRVADLAADLGLSSSGDPVTDLAAIAALLGDPRHLAPLLAGAPARARELLDRLTWGPPAGAVTGAERAVRAHDASGPLEWLLARGLLVPAGRDVVVLPREVGVALRGGVVLRALDDSPPPLDQAAVRADSAQAAATSRAREAVRLVGVLLDAWSAAPAPILRAGGLGVRELRRAADRLATSTDEAAFWVELAWAAGLLADDGEADPSWAPTPAYDTWREDDLAHRWAVLARSWWRTTRAPGLVGAPDARGSTRAALADDGDRTAAPLVRQAVLADLAALPPGLTATGESLLARLRWRWPRRTSQLSADLVTWALREAEWLGVTGAGAASVAGRALAAGADAAASLAASLPPERRTVLLQADLTAVAPSPLVQGVQTQLEELADVDSRGAATVYRFTAASVRRALDAGRSAAQIGAFLAEHSDTGVPQALSVLVEDAARRHGRLRVGAASAYLRSQDEAALAEVLADRRTAGLGLRSLAPTVAAAGVGPARVLDVLRTIGYAPALEGADADVLLGHRRAARAPDRAPPTPVGDAPPASPDRLDVVVAALRRADALAAAPGDASAEREPQAPPPLAPGDPEGTLAALHAAVAAAQTVWIGLADAAGRTSVRRLTPVDVTDGTVTAVDPATGRVSALSLHRVTGVSALAGG